MWSNLGYLFLLIIFLPCANKQNFFAEAKVVRGHLVTGHNWQFLARFCFLSLHGRFEYEIEYAEEFGVQNLDLYYDEASQWERVYGKKATLTSCREKESVLQVRFEIRE